MPSLTEEKMIGITVKFLTLGTDSPLALITQLVLSPSPPSK